MTQPVRTRPRAYTLLHLGVLSTLLLASTAIATGQPGVAVAQSASPVAASSACAPPAMVSAPIVPDTVTNGTPIANGTPVPVIGAGSETTNQIQTLVDSLAACLTAGDATSVSELVTDRYLGDAYGAGDRMTKEDYLALAPLAPVVPVTVQSVGQVVFASRDTVTAQVITVQGNQLRTEEWTFLFRRNRQPSATPVPASSTGEGQWLVHQVAVETSAAPQDAAKMTAVQSDYAIKLTPGDVKSENLVVTVENTGKETHEFLALKLNTGASVDALIRPTSDQFPSNIHVIGQETVPAGETRTIVFVGLEPGTYTVVCLLPDADGVPHLALGETATFKVS